MNEHLRDRILRKLDTLSDDRGYQVLDYVEFLESRYAERQAPNNAFTRFTEAIEDRMRAGKLSASAIAETMGLMNRAASVLGSALAQAGSVANDLVTGVTSATQSPPAAPRPEPGSGAPTPPPAGAKPPEPGDHAARAPGWGPPPTGQGASQQPPMSGPNVSEERL